MPPKNPDNVTLMLPENTLSLPIDGRLHPTQPWQAQYGIHCQWYNPKIPHLHHARCKLNSHIVCETLAGAQFAISHTYLQALAGIQHQPSLFGHSGRQETV